MMTGQAQVKGSLELCLPCIPYAAEPSFLSVPSHTC
jgi:hypothetical protein